MIQRFVDLVIDPAHVLAVSKVASSPTQSVVVFDPSHGLREPLRMPISEAAADALLQHFETTGVTAESGSTA